MNPIKTADTEKNAKKVLVFDVFGDYAHFRRIYTTTSPLTYLIPPRTALCGLIGAILGLSKDENEYLSYFTIDIAKIGLRVLNPIKKIVISENLIHTKKGDGCEGIGMNIIKKRTQISFEFLKDPKFRIYFWHADKKLYDRLKNNLLEHKSVYTPCLGLSENIANFEYVGEFDAFLKDKADDDFLKIHSVIPLKNIPENGVKFDVGDREYFSINLPVEMNRERIVTLYDKILLEKNGTAIETKITAPYWEIDHGDGEKENVFFIE